MVLILTIAYGDWSPGTDIAGRSMPVADYFELAALCQEARFDALFTGDTVQVTPEAMRIPVYRSAPYEPITMMTFLAAHTEGIGLIPTVSTTFSEPYNVARQLATLDYLSGGRAGWNVVTSGTGEDYRNFGLSALPSHAVRYRRAAEFLEVVRRLWRSWERDAPTWDGGRGVDIDPARIHPIGFEGEFFDVAGALNVPRPPQIEPVIVQAGASPQGLEFAAGVSDIVFSMQPTAEIGVEYHAAINERSRALRPGIVPPPVAAGVRVFIGETLQEAQGRHRAFLDLSDPDSALARVELFMGTSLAGLDWDEPIPEDRLQRPDGYEKQKTFYRYYWQHAAERRATLRELTELDLHWVVVGTPETVAAELAERFRSHACDGYNFQVTDRESFKLLARRVIPLLQEQGLVQREYRSPHLRTNLGRPLVN